MRYRLNLLLAVLTCRSRPNGNSRLPGRGRDHDRGRTGGVSHHRRRLDARRRRRARSSIRSPPTWRPSSVASASSPAATAEPTCSVTRSKCSASIRTARASGSPALYPLPGAPVRTCCWSTDSTRRRQRRCGCGHHRVAAGSRRARLHGRDREGDLSRVRASVNAIAVKVLPLHPLALFTRADFPTRSGRSCRATRRACACAIRARKADPRSRRCSPCGPDGPALFTRAGVRPTRSVSGATGPSPPIPPDVRMQLAVHQAAARAHLRPQRGGHPGGRTPPSSRSTCVHGHIDHIGTRDGRGCSARGADSICNGGRRRLGTVAVMELAQAFTQRASAQSAPGLMT